MCINKDSSLPLTHGAASLHWGPYICEAGSDESVLPSRARRPSGASGGAGGDAPRPCAPRRLQTLVQD